jgi:CRP-like cAMP-binding protein
MPSAANAILSALSAGDAEKLKPHLTPVRLQHKQVLFRAGDPVAAIYFPLDSVISLVITLSDGKTVESAMVGRDGAVGAAAALDSRDSLSTAEVQIPGNAMMCNVAPLRKAAAESTALMGLLARHEQAAYGQAQQSVACMAAHLLDARLPRWLLRARDLSGRDTLPLTQEYLAELLGTRRTTVTAAARTLQHEGLIDYRRGNIQILNGRALENRACECYASVKENYARLVARGSR